MGKISGYPASSAYAHLDDMNALGLIAISSRSIAGKALKIGLELGTTAYDACYVAAASETGLPLITADEKLARKTAGNDHNVRWLGELC